MGQSALDPFIDLSPFLMCTLDAAGRVEARGPAWEASLGWTPADLRTRPFSDLVYPADRALTGEALGRLRGGADAVVTFEHRCLARDGSYRWLSWRAALGPPGEDGGG